MQDDVERKETISFEFSILENSANGYDGDVTPRTAYEILSRDAAANLVDVRTSAEWTFVGIPDVSSIHQEAKFISWQMFPEMNLNADFINMLEASIPDKTSPVLFLCRSGARSASAARLAKAHGYEASFNIAGGFEGDANREHHRGGVNGWKSENLPWVQQ
ncbi:MAG: rhodanese-like domain-containing protein [Pseudomonadota bacterium]|nr:rhodanese-like domain-containing protein [Pseudomonadota bacterium]